MLRCTIEMVRGGDEEQVSVIGCVEIANIGRDTISGLYNYSVVLKKTPPFKGALRAAWKKGEYSADTDTEEWVIKLVEGFHRTKRGSYDLLYLALKACGLDKRNP